MSRHVKRFLLNWWEQHRRCFIFTALSHQKNYVQGSWLKQHRFKLNTEFLRLVFFREVLPSFFEKTEGNLKKNNE
jgi:hypothetical protein